jgi:hypothetical protein
MDEQDTLPAFFSLPNEDWTGAASDFSRECNAALRPIFLRYMSLGYSLRDMAYIAMTEAYSISLELIAARRRNKQP